MAFGLFFLPEYTDQVLAHDLDQMMVGLRSQVEAEHDEEGRHLPYEDYVPEWRGSVSSPSQGQVTGRWCRRGRMVTFEAHVKMEAATTYGSGLWIVTLPLPVKTPRQVFSAVGYDVSIGAVHPLAAVAANRSAALNADGKTIVLSGVSGAFVGPTVPFTWAAGDSLHVCGSYETVAD